MILLPRKEGPWRVCLFLWPCLCLFSAALPFYFLGNVLCDSLPFKVHKLFLYNVFAIFCSAALKSAGVYPSRNTTVQHPGLIHVVARFPVNGGIEGRRAMIEPHGTSLRLNSWSVAWLIILFPYFDQTFLWSMIHTMMLQRSWELQISCRSPNTERAGKLFFLILQISSQHAESWHPFLSRSLPSRGSIMFT